MDQQRQCEECPATAGGECLWVCGRGRTRLACEVRQDAADRVSLEVRRNARLYGMYHFAGRVAALAFAARLRQAFENNGWSVV